MSSHEKTQVLVIGCGALGTIYGHLLEKSGHCEVTAVARSTYELLTDTGPGVTIRSEKFGTIEGWKPHRAVRTVEQASDRDYAYVLVCTKALSELSPTTDIVRPLLAGKTANNLPTLVLLQNGLCIEKPFREQFPDLSIISGCAWIGAHFIVHRGLVEHGSFERIDLGIYTQEAKHTVAEKQAWLSSMGAQAQLQNLDKFVDLIRAGGGDAVAKEEIQIARWHKNIWNATISIFCCLSRTPVSDLCSPKVLEATLPALRRSMLEVLYVARNMGFDEAALPARVIDSLLKLTIQTWGPKDNEASSPLPVSEDTPAPLPLFPEAAYHDPNFDPRTLQSVGPDFRPSMLIDVETGRPTELEAVLGSVLDLARSTGTDTPRLDLLYGLMKVKQEKSLEAERTRIEAGLSAVMPPSPMRMHSNLSPRNDRVRGRPVYTPLIEMEEPSEMTWSSWSTER